MSQKQQLNLVPKENETEIDHIINSLEEKNLERLIDEALTARNEKLFYDLVERQHDGLAKLTFTMRGRITKYDCHTKIEAPAIQQGAGAFTITIEGMDERSKNSDIRIY
ncbi:hypothetical protein RhiirA1_480534 [Rhizophagus irregularis]|uniref:IDEAL domain-containing protein n=1 Tax=Rhizophagus irregularis TaxID=588596 RepID=A0A2N0QP74_9GLOM|nr:hypothetical protein RhiirA1_480534 [Rhizophagus irregularis]